MVTDYDNTNLIFERFAAYSMLTNGLIRVYNGQMLHYKVNRMLVSGTFFLEAIVGFNEMFVHHRIEDYSSMISMIISGYLGYYVVTM
jgi:hypothetical protein